MGLLKELAKLSEHGREQGYTHYEYRLTSFPSGSVHWVVGLKQDGSDEGIIGMQDESRAKAVVNLLNSDIGWHDSREDIGDIDG